MGGYQGQCNRFPGICLTTEENPRKPQLGNRQGAHTSATVIASNGVPSLQMKLVGSRYLLLQLNPFRSGQKSMPKNMRSRIQRSRDLWSAPTGHTSKILGGYGAYQQDQVMCWHQVSPFHFSSSYHTYTTETVIHTVILTSLLSVHKYRYTSPHVTWFAQEVHESKQTKLIPSICIAWNLKHIIVQWAGIKTHTCNLLR